MRDNYKGCMTTGKFPPETVLGSKEYFMDREKKMKAQIAALTEANEKLKSTAVCVYCGKKLIAENGKDKLAMIIDHMSLCDKHPVKKVGALLAEIDRLTADKKELVGGMAILNEEISAFMLGEHGRDWSDHYMLIFETLLHNAELIAKHGK